MLFLIEKTKKSKKTKFFSPYPINLGVIDGDKFRKRSIMIVGNTQKV